MLDICLAVTIVNQLQEWLKEQEGSYEIPAAQLTYAGDGTIDIGVGDIFALWCSESDNAEDMTLDFCKTVFLEEVKAWLPFVPTKKKNQAK